MKWSPAKNIFHRYTYDQQYFRQVHLWPGCWTCLSSPFKERLLPKVIIFKFLRIEKNIWVVSKSESFKSVLKVKTFRFIRSEHYKNLLACALNPGNTRKRFFNFPQVRKKTSQNHPAGQVCIRTKTWKKTKTKTMTMSKLPRTSLQDKYTYDNH